MKADMAKLAVFLCLWIGGLGLGCDGGKPAVEHPRGDEAWEMAHGVEVDETQIVARVGEQVITTADVEESWRHDPERSVQEIIDALVEREILALEAKARGYHERPEVSFARKQGMVSALLADEVEAKAEPDSDRREDMLERVMRIRRAPQGLRATHLVVLVPREVEDEEGQTKRLRGEERAAAFERGREIIEEIQHRLDGRVDDDALREVSAAINEEMDDDVGLEVIVEPHLLFPRAGEDYHADHLPRRWTQVASDFANGAETVADADRIGELSEPIETRIGWHLIRVVEVIEPREVDRDAAEAYVDSELEIRARQEKLRQKAEKWAEGLDASLYPDRLGSVFDDAI